MDLIGVVIDVDGDRVVLPRGDRERSDHINSNVLPRTFRSFLWDESRLWVFGGFVSLTSVAAFDVARDVGVHSRPPVVAGNELDSPMLSGMSSSQSIVTELNNLGTELCILRDVKLALVIN